MTRTPDLSMFWSHSLWEQLCHSVGTCYSTSYGHPTASQGRSPARGHSLPMICLLLWPFSFSSRGLLFLYSSMVTVIWSCYLVRRLTPTVVFPWELSIAVSRCFSRGNLTQLNSVLTFLKSPLNTEYKLSTPIFNAHPSTFLPHFPNFLLFRLPLRFKDHFTVCLFE